MPVWLSSSASIQQVSSLSRALFNSWSFKQQPLQGSSGSVLLSSASWSRSRQPVFSSTPYSSSCSSSVFLSPTTLTQLPDRLRDFTGQIEQICGERISGRQIRRISIPAFFPPNSTLASTRVHRIPSQFNPCNKRYLNSVSVRAFASAAASDPTISTARPLSERGIAEEEMGAAVDTSQRLEKLRELMKRENVDIYIVPSEDSHQSEYIAPCDARRAYICGFTGSAGTSVITLEKAAMATDGRYFNQASKQLDSNWQLLKQGLEDVPTWQEWTAEQSEGGKVVGVDPTLITASEARKLSEKIKKKGGADLVGVQANLVDEVWGDERPPRPKEKIKPLDLQYTGKPLGEKIDELRKEIEKKKSAGFIVSMLDEVAWLYNLRGNDIPYNPVFFSYAIVTPTTTTLYVDSAKFTPEVPSHLNEKVQIRPYESVLGDVKLLSAKSENVETEGDTIPSQPKRKYMISNKASWALSLELGGEDQVEEVRSPIGDAKAVKNSTEIAGMRACHVRDGAALTAYFAWLEESLLDSKHPSINEVEAADQLEHLRAQKPHFAGLSFDTISSVGPNAAIIHYKPEPDTCSTLDKNQIYLCDSGAQYLDGTTDTTRTLHFGEPTPFQRRAYTLVLKGVISLATAVFPKSTTGFALDAFARRALWQEGLDYRHGTGHGVGSYLNVHEGPVGVGTRLAYAEVGLSKGNVLSDEPGYYKDGAWGIRIENIVIVKEAEIVREDQGEPEAEPGPEPKTNGSASEEPAGEAEAVLSKANPTSSEDTESKPLSDASDPKESTKEPTKEKPPVFLTFETVTMVPLCRKLLDTSILTAEERKWIDEYHALVREKLWEELKGDERAKKWLSRETERLS